MTDDYNYNPDLLLLHPRVPLPLQRDRTRLLTTQVTNNEPCRRGGHDMLGLSTGPGRTVAVLCSGVRARRFDDIGKFPWTLFAGNNRHCGCWTIVIVGRVFICS